MRLSDDHVDIDGYIVGGLDPDTARAVELHLVGCADEELLERLGPERP